MSASFGRLAGPVATITNRAFIASPRFVDTVHRWVDSSHSVRSTVVWNRQCS